MVALPSYSSKFSHIAALVDVDASYLIALGVFVVFAFLLHFLVMKPLVSNQRLRYAGMDGARQEAAEAQLKAAEAKKSYADKIKAAKQDAFVTWGDVKDNAENEAMLKMNEQLSANDAEYRKVKASLKLAQEQADKDIHQQASDIADALVSKMLSGGK